MPMIANPNNLADIDRINQSYISYLTLNAPIWKLKLKSVADEIVRATNSPTQVSIDIVERMHLAEQYVNKLNECVSLGISI
jgi:hypothetical protein